MKLNLLNSGIFLIGIAIIIAVLKSSVFDYPDGSASITDVVKFDSYVIEINARTSGWKEWMDGGKCSKFHELDIRVIQRLKSTSVVGLCVIPKVQWWWFWVMQCSTYLLGLGGLLCIGQKLRIDHLPEDPLLFNRSQTTQYIGLNLFKFLYITAITVGAYNLILVVLK